MNDVTYDATSTCFSPASTEHVVGLRD